MVTNNEFEINVNLSHQGRRSNVLYSDSMTAEHSYLDVILDAARSSGRSDREISRAATGQSSALSMLRMGRVPSVERVRLLCETLGLEFYIGPPRWRGHDGPSSRDGVFKAADLLHEAEAELERLRAQAAGLAARLERDADAAAAGSGDSSASVEPISGGGAVAEPQADYFVAPFSHDVRAAAGSGEMVFGEASEFGIAFHRSALPAWARPDGLICIRAAGHSMEPTFHDGDLIALDRLQVDPVAGEMYVIHSSDGLLVKRLRKAGRGWELVSDNPAYPPRRAGRSDRLVGRVAWFGSPWTGGPG